MDENKIVTLEMFEKYHKQLMRYITGEDNSVLEDESEESAEEE